jgi:hypothetical protein
VYAFFTEAAKIVVNLRGVEKGGTGEWIDTWTGARERVAVAAAGVYTLDKPKTFGSAPGLLIVHASQ